MWQWLSQTIEILSRSGRWRTVRARHLVVQNACQACGTDGELEVHHIKPVHAGGDELDPDNLITLCRPCHFALGHACDWRAWRPEITALAKHIRRSPVMRS